MLRCGLFLLAFIPLILVKPLEVTAAASLLVGTFDVIDSIHNLSDSLESQVANLSQELIEKNALISTLQNDVQLLKQQSVLSMTYMGLRGFSEIALSVDLNLIDNLFFVVDPTLVKENDELIDNHAPIDKHILTYRGTGQGSTSNPDLMEGYYYLFGTEDVLTIIKGQSLKLGLFSNQNTRHTVSMWVSFPSWEPNARLLSLLDNDRYNGWDFYVANDGSTLTWRMRNAAATVLSKSIDTSSISLNTWHMITFAHNDQTGEGYMMLDGVVMISYSSDSIVAGVIAVYEDYSMYIGAAKTTGGRERYLPSGFKFGGLMIWNRYVSDTNMTALYEATRSRFGV